MALETSYPELDPSTARVVLVERLDRLLAGFDERLSDTRRCHSTQRGVEVRLGETVKRDRQDQGGAELGEFHIVRTWSSGPPASQLTSSPTPRRASSNRRPGPGRRRSTGAGRPEVFVTGDAAGTPGGDGPAASACATGDPDGNTRWTPGAQTRRGWPDQAFRYRDKGIMATIGRRPAVAQLPGRIRLRGTLAWLAWLGLHVVTLIGFRNRVSVSSTGLGAMCRGGAARG